jgi:hypothetical protein
MSGSLSARLRLSIQSEGARGRERDPEHRNVIPLPETLRCLCDFRGRLSAQCLGTIEAEELAARTLRFHHAV